MKHEELLNEFKGAEDRNPEAIIPLLEDPILRNCIVAWKSMAWLKGEIDKDRDCAYKDESSKWNWLWKGVSIDQQSFAKVAGVKDQESGQIIVRLIGLRLVYPDGTINKFAKQYLQSLILSKIGKKK